MFDEKNPNELNIFFKGVTRQGYVHNGKVYYEPRYGSKGGFGSSIVGAIVFIVIGLIMLLIGYGIESSANSSSSSSYSYGSNYSSYSSTPHVVFSYDNGTITPSYSWSSSPSYSSYSSNNSGSNGGAKFFEIAGWIVFLGGVVCLVSTLVKHNKLKNDLLEIGDVNGDGTIDINDLKYQKPVTGVAPKVAQSNVKPGVKPKTCRCQYCGDLIGTNEKKCSSCGAKSSYYYL